VTTSIKLLAVDQLDRRLPRLQKAAHELRAQTPRSGWVHTLRGALGLSERAFAKRLGFGFGGAVQELERNERSGSVTLERLRHAANALDADLIYALVPRKPLRETIAARARAVAKEHIEAVAHSMALEDQALGSSQLKRQVDELARELEKRPRALWR
jgi:predicted DNA-binding mobile mystery protein A